MVRGHDWNWKDQDGGAGKIGKIVDVQGWGQETSRSVANVSWPSSGITNVYRVGHKGKMDVQVASGYAAATNGHYYPGRESLLKNYSAFFYFYYLRCILAYFTLKNRLVADHLPVLGKVSTVSVSLPAKAVSTKQEHHEFSKHEKVKITVSLETLEALQVSMKK